MNIRTGELNEVQKTWEMGTKISEIALGSWMTDLKSTEAVDTAKRTLRLAYGDGVNFLIARMRIATALLEIFLGNTLKEFTRSSYVVSSKVFFLRRKSPNDRGLSRSTSLSRLTIPEEPAN